MVGVCEIIRGYEGQVRLAAPSDLAVSIRQYDGSIKMPYGRYWGDNTPLRVQLDLDYPDVDNTLKLAGENACDFIVVNKNNNNLAGFLESGQEIFGETENYYVVKIKNIPRIQYIYNKFCQVSEIRYIDKDGKSSVVQFKDGAPL